jgi:hypothetical protein
MVHMRESILTYTKRRWAESYVYPFDPSIESIRLRSLVSVARASILEHSHQPVCVINLSYRSEVHVVMLAKLTDDRYQRKYVLSGSTSL